MLMSRCGPLQLQLEGAAPGMPQMAGDDPSLGNWQEQIVSLNRIYKAVLSASPT